MNRLNRVPEETWSECPPGTMTQLQRHMRGIRRREFAQRIAVSSALAGLVLVGAWSVQHAVTPSSTSYGGVSCEFVLSNLNAYSAGELTLDQQASVGEHLLLCPTCRAKMDAMSRQPIQVEAGPMQTAGDTTPTGGLAMLDGKNEGQGYPPHRAKFSTNVN